MPIRSRDMSKTVKNAISRMRDRIMTVYSRKYERNSYPYQAIQFELDRISAKILKGTYTGQAIQFESNIKPLALSVLEISYEQCEI